MATQAARAGKHFCTVACTSRLLVVAARLPLVPALTTLTCCNHAAGRAAIRGGTLYAKTMTATAPATGAHGTTRCAAAMAKHHPDEPAATVLLGKLQRPSQYAPRAQQGRRDHQACATTALQANIKDPREQPSAWIAPGERCLVVLVLPRAPIAPLEGISPARDRPHAPSALLDSVMRAQPRASVAVPASIQPLEAAARTAWLVGTVLRSQHRASAVWLVSTLIATRRQPAWTVPLESSRRRAPRRAPRASLATWTGTAIPRQPVRSAQLASMPRQSRRPARTASRASTTMIRALGRHVLTAVLDSRPARARRRARAVLLASMRRRLLQPAQTVL